MHLGTIRTATGQTRAAVRDDEHWVLLDAPDVGELVAAPGWRAQLAAALAPGSAAERRADGELAAPVARPAKIVCCGLNYHDHIVETGRDIPEYPTLFAKFADTLTGPSDDIEIIGSAKVDWEAELAVVIGAPLKRASRAEAAAGILGYTVANDVSCRDWQARTLQWFQGKAWDRTTPIGPVIVTADAIDPAAGLAIHCEIDGHEVQRSSTRELVFDAAELVAYVSQFTELRPGDLILTGTPGGVGLGASPQRWLRDGETLTTTIEGIGTLRNTLRVTPPLADPEEARA
ncbi:fumarylacetoacetate hydrolase family protein [Leucobacter chromiireducens]|uniref:fumarylacetoacetate hydrolase family protein n=1 Tax=Leucobacter chromiireducens TaxID=283877 RepID=UPI000F63E8CF|nr:fumarylacetoacetate hydrolase family protein [Leucobacter chromiireducens]